MGYTTNWSAAPQVAPKDYKTAILSPTIKVIEGQEWLFTPPMDPSAHPWSEKIERDALPSAACQVIAMQHGVHPHAGDLYFDIEVYCPSEDAYALVSYSEND